MITIIACLQKEKWKIMVFITINNLFSVLMYLSFSRYASMALSVIAFIRTAIFAIYAYKGIKPNVFVLIAIEIAFLITGILTWQDSLDIIPILAMLEIGYATWQDNTAVLRVGYIINCLLYIVFYLVIGAYIVLIPEIFMLLTNSVSLIYYDILKKEKPMLSALKTKWFKHEKQQDCVNLAMAESNSKNIGLEDKNI